MLAAFLLSATLGCAPPVAVAADDAARPTWRFDAEASRLLVQVFRDTSTLGSDLSHDHVVLATGWSGSVSLDPQDLSKGCTVEVTVPVAGLRPDLPEMRELVGYGVMLTEAQRDQVAEHMLSEAQLNGAAFSDITFRSQKCEGSLERLSVTGPLRIRGRAHTVTLPLALKLEEGKLQATGSFSASHADFGFEPYSAMFGQLRNREDMTFVIRAVAKAP